MKWSGPSCRRNMPLPPLSHLSREYNNILAALSGQNIYTMLPLWATQ
jgi:hypothetical protein